MLRRVINLTRLGDLLQTQPVFHALKEKGEKTGLVCLENFADAVHLLQDVDHHAVLPGSALLAALNKNWPEALIRLDAWVHEERNTFPAQATLNLTPTISARLLSRALQPDRQPDGFSLDPDGFGRNGSPWGIYTQAVSLCRGCSPFNLVDSFRLMAGVADRPARYQLQSPEPHVSAAVMAELEEAASASGLNGSSGFVAFQLGASHPARRWPEQSFASVGRDLYRHSGVIPVLVGSANERPLAAAYLQEGGVGLDFCGHTDLIRLAAVLQVCRLLITNDTGTMHLAAGLGVPVLALFLATAQPWDTGPYAVDLCCLEPRMDCHPCGFRTSCPHEGRCRTFLAPPTVTRLATEKLTYGHWPLPPFPTEDARVWVTCRDEQGFLDLRSLSGDEHTDRTAWIRIQRAVYRHFLDEMQNQEAAGQESQSCQEQFAAAPCGIDLLPEELLQRTVQNLSPERRQRLTESTETIGNLLLLAEQQQRLLAVQAPTRLKQSFLGTCERIRNLFQGSPDFVPLSFLWRSMIQEYADDRNSLLSLFAALRAEMDGLHRIMSSE